MELEHFFPRIQVDTCAQMCSKVKLLGGCRCRPHSNYWGIQSNYRGIYPPSSRVSAPLDATCKFTFERRFSRIKIFCVFQKSIGGIHKRSSLYSSNRGWTHGRVWNRVEWVDNLCDLSITYSKVSDLFTSLQQTLANLL